MNKIITAVLLTALIPATSFANLENGNMLLAECTNEGTEIVDYMHRSQCSGYIKGAIDAHHANVYFEYMNPTFCIPASVTVEQLTKIVVKQLNDNPDQLHLLASLSVNFAIISAFPPRYKDDGTRYCEDEK